MEFDHLAVIEVTSYENTFATMGGTPVVFREYTLQKLLNEAIISTDVFQSIDYLMRANIYFSQLTANLSQDQSATCLSFEGEEKAKAITGPCF